MKVAVGSTKYYEREYLNKFNTSSQQQLTFFDNSLTGHSTKLTIGFDAVCGLLTDKIDEAVIDKLSVNNIKLIVLRSAGFDNVDIAAAAKRNIKVLRVPAYSPQAIAKHAAALILTLDRKTYKAYNRVKENNFTLNNLMGFNLYEKQWVWWEQGKQAGLFATLCLALVVK